MSHGVDWSDTHQPFLLASAEKALLDTLYISTRKSKRFSSLPELDLHVAFDHRAFERLLNELPYPVRIRSAIATRWSKLGA